MKGDTVEVALFPTTIKKKRPEGFITKIIERGFKEVIGTLKHKPNISFVIPDNPSFNKDIIIEKNETETYQDGEKVLVKIIEWNEQKKNPIGKIIDILSNNKLNDIAMKEILIQNGFSLVFPEEVLKESEQLSEQIEDNEIKNRLDFRSTFTLTIDPYNAKDFDDAISYKKLENGLSQIGVHIADVSHYLNENSELDKEAYQRATSVYLPDRVIPMLPEKISNELCSLRPHEDKLTFAVIFEIDDDAQIKSSQIAKTIIHSNQRFTYEQIQHIIETQEGPHLEEVLFLNSISQKLRSQRFNNGAINFSSEETSFVLDENGVPEAVEIKVSKEAHQLIEELMLLANKTVAEFISKKKYNHQEIPFPYRVHDIPDFDKLIEFVDFAKKFNYQFNLSTPKTIAESFNKMLLEANKHPEHQILHVLGIRTMAKAFYSTKNIGHYGLAFEHYCHFTSPIRRYPDILVHRIIYKYLQQKQNPIIQQLENQCVHCSERERKAMESEREGMKYKQVEFMTKFIGKTLQAVISGVAGHGFWAQTVEQKCEGFIPLSSLNTTDEFKFIPNEFTLVGQNTKVRFQIGKNIKVKVLNADLFKKQIEFELVND
ncbi:MAG: ribonuclease R [Bacteroidetes bacterium OLB11]|nr:MAG: ribonuclease R [Bacteroidetes bacterium OLB11]